MFKNRGKNKKEKMETQTIESADGSVEEVPVEKSKIKKGRKKKASNTVQIDRERSNEIEEQVERDMLKEDPTANKSSRKFKRIKKAKVEERLQLRQTFLDNIKPVGNIKFNSQDMLIDGKYASILTFIVRPGEFNKLRPLWGIDAIPRITSSDPVLANRVEMKMIQSISRRPEDWVENKIPAATEVATSGYEETARASQAMETTRYKRRYDNIKVISDEIANGASYLDLSIRIIIKALDRKDMLDAQRVLEREYSTVFASTVQLVPFVGEQHLEYAGMLNSAEDQLGENYQLTSIELAGSYPFVTKGINDPDGTYVGSLAKEINADPVLLNTIDFDHLAVVYSKGLAADLSSYYNPKIKYKFGGTTAWSAKMTQDALMHGHRVIHLVLNGEDPRRAGKIDLNDQTAYVDLTESKVGINMMEPFSVGQDEFGAFTQTTDKIKAIIRQFSKKVDITDDTTLKSADFQNLSDLLRDFYVNEGMWRTNAKTNTEALRFLGIPSKDVPTLSRLVIYAKSRYQAEVADSNQGGGSGNVDSYKKIYGLLKEISDNYGDLFDRKTTIRSEALSSKTQIIFDFGSLKLRSDKALMGQFINAFNYAERELREGDILIIHGMDEMSDTVCEYLDLRFRHLEERQAKVVLMYQYSDILFDSKKLHQTWFEKSDMKLTNSMTASSAKRYAEVLNVELPFTVRDGMTSGDRHIYLIVRGRETILFNFDMAF